MPEIVPGGAPGPVSVLGWDGSHFYVLRVDATGHLQIDVVTSTLPAGAATAANQATMITALQLIDDLRAALQSVAGDRLQVRGEDQLFTLKDDYDATVFDLNAGAGVNALSLPSSGAGIWRVITGAIAFNRTTACTRIAIQSRTPVASSTLAVALPTVIYEPCVFNGPHVLPPTEEFHAEFAGCAAGDDIFLHAWGYDMTVET